MSYSSPSIFVFYLFHGFMLLCICFTISLHSPARFLAPFLAHRPYGPFPLLLQRVVPPNSHTQIPCFIPLASPFPFSCSTYTPATFTVFTTHTITVFTTQYSPCPSQTHTPPHLFPPSPLPHQLSIPYINRPGIPIPVIHNK